jgi:hypothetical protein
MMPKFATMGGKLVAVVLPPVLLRYSKSSAGVFSDGALSSALIVSLHPDDQGTVLVYV